MTDPTSCRCGGELKVAEHLFATAVQPELCFRCAACDDLLMLFSIKGKDEKLQVWRSDKLQEEGFTDFIARKLERRMLN